MPNNNDIAPLTIVDLQSIHGALLDDAPYAIAVVDRQMRYLAFSQRWLSDYRLDGQELLGRSHYDVFPEISDEWKAIHQECLTGITRSCEFDPFPRMDGGTDYVTWQVSPWWDAGGRVGGLVMHTTVHTDQVVAEQRRVEHEREMYALLHSTKAIPWRLDLDSQRFTYMGEQIEALLGYPQGSWDTMQTWATRIHPQDRDWVVRHCHAEAAAGKDHEIEYRLVGANGEHVWVRDVVSVQGDVGGRTVAMAGFLIDISAQKSAEEGLRLSEAKYRTVLETTGDGFWLVDVQGFLLEVNDAYAQRSGYRKEELVGMHITELEAKEVPEETAEHIRKIIRDGHDLFETRHRTKCGEEWDVEISVSFSSVNGDRFCVFSRDITERKRTQQQLKLVAEVFKNTSEGIVITDRDGVIVDVNEAYCGIMGYSREEMIGQRPSKVSSGRHDKTFFRDMWQAILNEGQWIGEVWDRRKNGEVFPKWLSINAVHDEHGEVSYFVGTFSDISQLKDAQEQLQMMAYCDALTGLPNRLMFQEHLELEIASSRRFGHKCAVLFLDLDRFKYVNDSLGHSAGDELLIEVARRISATIRDTDTVARLGGDEFTLILREITNIDAVALVAMKIIDELKRPFRLQGNEVRTGASIGISIYPDDGSDRESLTMHADAAMYEAKSAGRGQYHFYAGYMDEFAHEHLRLENDLHKAIEEDLLFLTFQPQLDTCSGELVCAEALIRWRHPEFGIIPPAKFIPLAEENGMILAIGEWVIRSVCEHIRVWLADGLQVPPIAVNLSARQFRQEALIARIEAIIADYGLPPQLLEFEITESVAMEDAAAAATRLHELSASGFSIAIDDFGTGYSSLNYLKRFPANKIKLDRSFVGDIPDDANDMAIAAAVIHMAHRLGHKVVAEGVETEAQADFLKAEGCDVMQGYLFSKPLECEAFAQFIARSAQKKKGKRATA